MTTCLAATARQRLFMPASPPGPVALLFTSSPAASTLLNVRWISPILAERTSCFRPKSSLLELANIANHGCASLSRRRCEASN